MNGAIRSLRILRKNWKLTAVSIFSLSIAMAIGVVSLGVSNTALLIPPPGASPERLVQIYLRSPGAAIDHISYPDYEYYRQNNHVFTDVAAVPQSVSVTIDTDSGKKETFLSINVSTNYFSVLGIRPYLGRFFSPDDANAKQSVAVLSYSCWTHLGSDPNIVGKVVDSRTIVGVTPKEFTGYLFGLNGDLLLPVSPETSDHRGDRHLILLARLKPGVTRSQAQSEMTLLSSQLAAAYPKEDKDRAAILTRATLLPPDAVPTAEILIGILISLVLLVLLIACANVANLLLALAVGRRQEAAVKLALGSSRLRLIAEFLRESALVCAVSGALGFLLAVAAIRRYSNFTVNLPEIGAYSFGLKLHLGAPVIAGALVLMLIAVLATGLPAALYASSPSLSHILSGEIAIGGTRKAFRRNALVVVQIAVCTLVLVGMGLCQRSVYNLRHADLGFSARNLIAETLFMHEEGFSEAKGRELYGKVTRTVAALPGVESVSLSGGLPLLYGGSPVNVQASDDAKPASIPSIFVDSNYFSTFSIPVIAGRVFSPADTSPTEDVIVINRKMAETLWPNQDAIGRALFTGEPARRGVVIGVVADAKYGDIDESPEPRLYYALSQHYQQQVDVVARTKGDPQRWIEPLAQALKENGFQAPLRPITFKNWEDISLFPNRVVARGVAAFSALGLLLAIVGLFGAISYSVSERKRELGIRVALGAQYRQLLAMILRQTLVIAAVGTLIGIVLGIAATVLARSQFYGIAAVEWSVLVPVSVGMLAVSLAVAYFSAVPWIKVDPASTLRSQ